MQLGLDNDPFHLSQHGSWGVMVVSRHRHRGPGRERARPEGPANQGRLNVWEKTPGYFIPEADYLP
jgi:hypothetical protein